MASIPPTPPELRRTPKARRHLMCPGGNECTGRRCGGRHPGRTAPGFRTTEAQVQTR